MEELIRGPKLEAGHLSPTSLTHPYENHNILIFLFQIPALLSAGDLPPPLTHDAFSSSLDISNTLSPLPPSRSSPYPLRASAHPSFPHTNLRPYGSTFLSLRFDSSSYRAHHCSPCRQVSNYSISLSRSLPIQNTCHDSDLTRPSPVLPLLPHNP
jgi:hypothetical protein